MPFEDACGQSLDGLAVTDVAHLGLATGLLGQRAQPVCAAGDEHAVPPTGGEQARGRLPDSGRCAGDHRNPLHGGNVTQMSGAQSVSPQATFLALR